MSKTAKTTAFIAISFFLSAFSPLFSQISSGGIPLSFLPEHFSAFHKKELNPSLIPLLDLEKVNREDEKQNESVRFAAPVEVSFNLQNSGDWINLSNGDRVWRIELNAPNALGLFVLYDDFYLPEGSQLHMYSPDHRQLLGSYTHRNNKASGKFMTGMIKGESAILEYYEPKTVEGQGIIDIFRIYQAYEPILMEPSDYEFQTYDGFGDGLSCHVNINCTEGDPWQVQKRGVVRMLRFFEEGVGWCSGSMINNTNQDEKPYLLSAFHCIAGLTPLYDFWRFDFNYESNNCTDPAIEPGFQSIIGCTYRAGREESDFMLLELSVNIPSSYGVYFNGWNRDDVAVPASSAGVHHPQGDIKKVSVDVHPAIIFQSEIIWNNNVTTPPNHHFRVLYDSGTIENGSSGSPLFDQNGYIVGQLHGGNASCTTFTTYYGRMSKSWDAGPTVDTRLMEWLDPSGSGVMTLNGMGTPPPAKVTISGNIMTPDGDPVGNAMVWITGEMTYLATTDNSGNFTIPDVPEGGNYSVVPQKLTMARNGVNSIDVILIARELLGIQPFNDPYQDIAADVDNTNTLNTFDIIEIRRLMLFYINEFSNADSWHFDPPSIPFNNLSGNQSNQNYIGIKKGDVNFDANGLF